MKRIVTYLITMCLILSSLTVAAYAEEEEKSDAELFQEAIDANPDLDKTSNFSVVNGNLDGSYDLGGGLTMDEAMAMMDRFIEMAKGLSGLEILGRPLKDVSIENAEHNTDLDFTMNGNTYEVWVID